MVEWTIRTNLNIDDTGIKEAIVEWMHKNRTFKEERFTYSLEVQRCCPYSHGALVGRKMVNNELA